MDKYLSMKLHWKLFAGLTFLLFTTFCYSQNSTIKIFDDSSGEISQYGISDDSRYFSVGNKLGIVTVWDYQSKEEIFKVRHHKEPIKFIWGI